MTLLMKGRKVVRLNNDLLPHQVEGVKKLSKLKVGALFMEQGTGKTITALELCRLRMEQGKVEKIIWLCPCSAKQNIKAEIIKQAPKQMLEGIVICGIETLSSSIRANAYLRNLVIGSRCFLVVDESLLIKNPKAYRTENIIWLSQKCQYKLILNGTPISRNEADLFSQFFLLDWRILGYKSYWSFAANHLEYDPVIPGKVVRCLNTEYLARKIEPYSYQVKKRECLTLPHKYYKYWDFCMTEEQWEHYEYIADILLYDVDEMKPETIYKLFTAMQAIACGRRVVFFKDNRKREHIRSKPFFGNAEENPRMQVLMDLADMDEKCIIFCTYEDDITKICEAIEARYGIGSVVRFDGKISNKKRAQNIQEFSRDARWFVANRNCASYSLNLQFCHNIIYFANTWDLATRLQSEDRVHRIGQDSDIRIWDIFAESTIDERIWMSLQRKENLLESFKDEIKSMGSKEKIKDFLNLKRPEKGNVRDTIYDCSDLMEV